MGLDYGRDAFNSGVILYKPQPNMFEDFQQFLQEKILPMPEKQRGQVVRPTQRLLTEFLLLPSSPHELVSFCPGVQSFNCHRAGCHCGVHIYPTVLDCNKDKDLERLKKGTIAHFAGNMLNYETLCDPGNNAAENIEATFKSYEIGRAHV